jgi:hypothetical protein
MTESTQDLISQQLMQLEMTEATLDKWKRKLSDDPSDKTYSTGAMVLMTEMARNCLGVAQMACATTATIDRGLERIEARITEVIDRAKGDYEE